MIPANRTSLLQMREKKRSYTGSLHILQARRQALIFELFQMTKAFRHSRHELRKLYAQAIFQQEQAYVLEGAAFLASLAAAADTNKGVLIRKKNTLGIEYKEITLSGVIKQPVWRRGYAIGRSTPALEEALSLFEEVVLGILDLSVFENKFKRLGEKIVDLSRKVRVLDEKIIPQLKKQMHLIAQQLGEREREEHYRLKQFKKGRERLAALAPQRE